MICAIFADIQQTLWPCQKLKGSNEENYLKDIQTTKTEVYFMLWKKPEPFQSLKNLGITSRQILFQPQTLSLALHIAKVS